ncbi:MAG: hypothetical protein ACTFAK_07645 [Candidatus Electronema sp. VV]
MESLKLLRSAGWQWLTRLEHRYPSVGPFCPSQRLRHDQGVQDPDIEDWASRDLYMSDLMRLRHAELSWMIKTCHRGVKQFCGIERCQARPENAQRNHIEMATRAFLRIEKPICTLDPINLYAAA